MTTPPPPPPQTLGTPFLAFEDEDDDLTVHMGEPEDVPFPPLYTAVVGPPHTVGEHGDNQGRVQALLDAGEDVNEKTDQGWTPLMASGSTGQPNIMRLLLRHGASLDSRDCKNNSVLDWTLHRSRGFPEDIVFTLELHSGHEECVSLLRAASLPWSPQTHGLFPQAQRLQAVEVLHIGYLLSRTQPLGRAFLDAWVAVVMPLVIVREPVGRQCSEPWLTSTLAQQRDADSNPAERPVEDSVELHSVVRQSAIDVITGAAAGLAHPHARGAPTVATWRHEDAYDDAHDGAHDDDAYDSVDELAQAVVASLMLGSELQAELVTEEEVVTRAQMARGEDAARRTGRARSSTPLVSEGLARSSSAFGTPYEPAGQDVGTDVGASALLMLANAMLAAQGPRPTYGSFATLPPSDQNPFAE